jgi:hypothetical protein
MPSHGLWSDEMSGACGALALSAGDASNFGKHIFSPSQRWPHQHMPSALMMQVPVPQHLGSSLIQILQGLAAHGVWWCVREALQAIIMDN